jgi:hypothetical protein
MVRTAQCLSGIEAVSRAHNTPSTNIIETRPVGCSTFTTRARPGRTERARRDAGTASMTTRLGPASRRPHVEPVAIWVSLEQQTPRVPIREGRAMGRTPRSSHDHPVRRLQPADPPLEIAALLAQRRMVATVPSFQLALPMGGHLVLSPRKIRQPRDLHGIQPGPHCASRQRQRHARTLTLCR